MIIRMTTFNLLPNKVEELTKIYANEIVPEVRRQKGNLDCKLLEPLDNTQDYVSLTTWDNKRDAEAYHSSGTYKRLVDKVRKYFTKDAVLKIYRAEDILEHA